MQGASSYNGRMGGHGHSSFTGGPQGDAHSLMPVHKNLDKDDFKLDSLDSLWLYDSVCATTTFNAQLGF